MLGVYGGISIDTASSLPGEVFDAHIQVSSRYDGGGFTSDSIFKAFPFDYLPNISTQPDPVYTGPAQEIAEAQEYKIEI